MKHNNHNKVHSRLLQTFVVSTNQTVAVALKAFILAVAINFTALSLGSARSEEQPLFVIVGTAGVTGVYYPMGGAICSVLNRNRRQHGVHCSVESTRGSAANLKSLANSELDFAIAQSDAQHHAYDGINTLTASAPNTELRSILALHVEPFTVVARADTGINTFDDLQGRRVNIGNPGSGHRETMQAVMRAKHWTESNFLSVSELNSAEHSQALCDNEIDAYVFTVGHPAASIKEAANTCDVVIVRLTGAEIDQMVAEHSYFSKAAVPGGIYRGNTSDTPTLGVRASLISSTATSDQAVYSLVKSVFENVDTIKKMHPAFRTLGPEALAQRNSEIPLHKGALRYYQEVGLMK